MTIALCVLAYATIGTFTGALAYALARGTDDGGAVAVPCVLLWPAALPMCLAIVMGRRLDASMERKRRIAVIETMKLKAIERELDKELRT